MTKDALHSALAPRSRLETAWLCLSNPLTIIIACALFGLSIAVVVARIFSEVCSDAMAHWDLPTKRWVPGEALLLGWKVSAETCKDISKNPPWLLLSGLTAAPSVLLTWYWRDKKRRDDHQLAVQVAFSERYTKATELLAHADVMTRINGLESLWDIAVQSEAHRAAVSRTLAAFVRTRSRPARIADRALEVGILGRAEPTDEVEANTLPADVQQAMTLLVRREWESKDWPRTQAELDLRKAHLRNVDVQEGQLRLANLEEANLQGANLFQANLEGANLHDADLRGASLTGTNLGGANLHDADVQGASLYGAKLQGADLEGANLEGALLQGAILEDSYLYRAKLSGAKLQGAKLGAAIVGEANLRGAELHGAHLQGAHLEDAHLQGANLQGADAQGAYFEGANLQGAKLACVEYLEGANFQGAFYDSETTLPFDEEEAMHLGMKKEGA